MLRLSRKADVDIHTRLITSIYLPEEEFAALLELFAGFVGDVFSFTFAVLFSVFF